MDDEHTPPRGSAKRNTAYSQMDDRSLLERAADNAFQARSEVRKLRDDWAEIRRPYMRPWYERGAPAALVVVIVMWFVAWTARTSTAAPEPSHVQAAR